jgi:hypothetical protein
MEFEASVQSAYETSCNNAGIMLSHPGGKSEASICRRICCSLFDEPPPALLLMPAL